MYLDISTIITSTIHSLLVLSLHHIFVGIISSHHPPSYFLQARLPPLAAPRKRSLNVPLVAAAAPAGELLKNELPSIIELLPSMPKLLLPWPKSTPRLTLPTTAAAAAPELPGPNPLGSPELLRPELCLPLILLVDRRDRTELICGTTKLLSTSLSSSSSESVCS